MWGEIASERVGEEIGSGDFDAIPKRTQVGVITRICGRSVGLKERILYG